MSTYRQGDILLVPVEGLPADLTELPRLGGRLVLAMGEATGHAHVIDAPPEEATLLTTDEGERFLRLVAPAPLIHEEHGSVRIEPGLYRLPPQVEWTDDDEPRRVSD